VPFTVHAYFAEDAAEGIATFVRDHAIDFVALSTHGRSGLGQALLGSVAGAVVRHSPVPVILVGPDATLGFAPDTSRN
jgi:nucleotide-binding universal stress UspA family protein